MKRNWVRVLGAVCAISIAACGKDVTQTVRQEAIVTVIVGTGSQDQNGAFHLSKDAKCQNHTMSLTGRVAINNGVPVSGTWKSSDNSIATVDPVTGLVTAVAPGVAKITFVPNDSNLATSSVEIIVDDTSCTSAPAGTSSISFTPHGGQLAVGGTQQLIITCSNLQCVDIIIDSSDPTVVSTNSLTRTITCMKAGTANITVHPTGSNTPLDQAQFTCVAVNPTVTGVTVSPNGATYTLTGTNGVCQNLTIPFGALVSGANNPSQGVNWTTSNGTITSGGMLSIGVPGPVTVTATSQQDPSKSGQATNNVIANCGTANTTLLVNPNLLNLSNCVGFVAAYTPVVTISGTNTQVPVTWSGIGNLGTTNGGSFTLNGNAGSATLIGTTSTGATVQLPVTVTQCQTAPGSITVSPNPLNIPLAQIGTVTATPSNVSGTPTWTSTTGCTTFTNPNSLVTGIQGSRVCRDSDVVQIGNVKGYVIVNVTSGASSCTWARADGSSSYSNFGVNQSFQANGSCTYQGAAQQPYWYSTDPSRFTVVGAPFACTIGGVVYPCGPNATIKAIAAGSADVCDQAAVQDPTVKFCRTLTAVVGGTGNLIPNDRAAGLELDVQKQLGIKWPSKAAPAEARITRIVPMSQYYDEVRKMQLKNP